MKKIMIGISLLALCFGLVAPASAENEGTETENTKPREVRIEARKRAESRQQTSEDKEAEIKAAVEARRTSLKQDICENREARIKERVPKIVNAAKRLKGVIDRKYERVQDFYESGKLTVSNYEELVSAIETAKTTSETSLQALESYEFEVDCAAGTAAEQLDSFRTAAKAARDDLKTYRKALVDLISALRAAAAEQNNTNDTGDSNE